MNKFDAVIKGLECCKNRYPLMIICTECPYEKSCYREGRNEDLLSDVLAFLKERRLESRWITTPYKKARFCERCGHDEPYKFADEDADVYDYCPHCGAKMTN